MAFSPPEYCRLFSHKKAYQGGVTGTPGPPSSYAPVLSKKNTNMCSVRENKDILQGTQTLYCYLFSL